MTGNLTIKSLRKVLEEEEIPRESYSLEGGHPSEAFVLESCAGGWRFYYSERGEESAYEFFLDEGEACVFFHAMVTENVLPTLRRYETQFEKPYRAEIEKQQEHQDPE